MSTSDLLSLSLVAVLVLTMVLWYRIPAPRPRLFRQAAWLFSAALLLEIWGFLARLKGWDNDVGYNLFQLYEFIVMLLLIRTAEPTLHRSVLWAGLIGVAGFVWRIRAQGGLGLLSADAIVIFAFLLSTLLVRSLFLLAKKCDTPLHRLPAFWFFFGCFLYFVGLVPLIAGIHLVYTSDRPLAAAIWFLVPILAILRYAFAAWACRLEVANKYL